MFTFEGLPTTYEEIGKEEDGGDKQDKNRHSSWEQKIIITLLG